MPLMEQQKKHLLNSNNHYYNENGMVRNDCAVFCLIL